MNCPQCDYRLWNLNARRCPECGRAFVPSEFEFAPNSVQFCCPHCSQIYYGTDANGHLVPRAFNCASCGRHIEMDEMVLRPTEGLEEEQTSANRMPWLQVEKLGLIGGWFRTVGRALVNPGSLMSALPSGSPISRAWGFAVCTAVAVAAVLCMQFCSLPLIGMMVAGGVGGLNSEFAVAILIVFFAGIAMTLIYAALWGLVAHGILALGGSTPGGLGRTYEAICYSSGANVVTATPCLGTYVGWIWWLVSAILMLKEGQRISGARATLAIVPFPVVIVVSLIGGYVWFVVSMMGAFTTMGAATGSSVMLGSAITNHAVAGNPAGPRHIALLGIDNPYLLDNCVRFDTATLSGDVPVGSMMLDEFVRESTRPERAAAAQEAVDMLPDDVIAYRLGDFVFCYCGANLAPAPTDLWVMISSPDPDSNGGPIPTTAATVVDAAGLTHEIPSDFANRLAEQNALRATLGLSPLPDPTTITHDAPAVAQTPAESP